MWQNINTAFSTPVSRDDQVAEYAPTQILAEYLRENHSDGIIYRSRLGPGRNIALFDLESATMPIAELFQVKAVSYQYDSADGPYSLTDSVKTDSGQ